MDWIDITTKVLVPALTCIVGAGLGFLFAIRLEARRAASAAAQQDNPHVRIGIDAVRKEAKLVLEALDALFSVVQSRDAIDEQYELLSERYVGYRAQFELHRKYLHFLFPYGRSAVVGEYDEIKLASAEKVLTALKNFRGAGGVPEATAAQITPLVAGAHEEYDRLVDKANQIMSHLSSGMNIQMIRWN